MKRTVYFSLLRCWGVGVRCWMLGVGCWLMASCSNISDDERLIYVKPAQVSRSVLIEDFTGQRCVNCPNASQEIHRLQEQYGADAVIAVAIHSGPLGFKTKDRFVGLKTDVGDLYYNHWHLEYQPVGMVDRTGVSDFTSWGAHVRDELQRPAPVSITLSVAEDAGRYTVSASIMGTDGSTSGHLQLWLTEDDVTAFQLMPDGTRQDDYLHQHVFREALNGTWGQELSVLEGETATLSAEPFTPSSDYNADNLSVVAFVYDDSGVKQVAKTKLKQQ